MSLQPFSLRIRSSYTHINLKSHIDLFSLQAFTPSKPINAPTLLAGKLRSRVRDMESSECSMGTRAAYMSCSNDLEKQVVKKNDDTLGIQLKRGFKLFEKTFKMTERVLQAQMPPNDPEDRPSFFFKEASPQKEQSATNTDLGDVSDVLEVKNHDEFWLKFKSSPQ